MAVTLLRGHRAHIVIDVCGRAAEQLGDLVNVKKTGVTIIIVVTCPF